jgi:DNA-binding Lrp family transcriptional regulator
MVRQKIDKIDITIIRNLQLDARTNYTDIARQCDVSVDTIIKRYHKLQEKGIITDTTLLLDPRKLDKKIIAHFNIDTEPHAIPEILNYLEKQPGIIFTTHAMGEYDVFTIAQAQTMNEMNKLKEKIQSHTMIRETKTSIWVDQFLLCPQNFELENLLETEQ